MSRNGILFLKEDLHRNDDVQAREMCRCSRQNVKAYTQNNVCICHHIKGNNENAISFNNSTYIGSTLYVEADQIDKPTVCTCLLAIHYIHVAIIRRITTISDNLRTRVVIKGHSRVICTNIPDFHAGPAGVVKCDRITESVAKLPLEKRVTFLFSISLETCTMQLPIHECLNTHHFNMGDLAVENNTLRIYGE